MTISEGTFGSVDDLFDAGISGTYASIRTYSNYAEAWGLWSEKTLHRVRLKLDCPRSRRCAHFLVAISKQ